MIIVSISASLFRNELVRHWTDVERSIYSYEEKIDVAWKLSPVLVKGNSYQLGL